MNLITVTYNADTHQLVPKNLTAENGAKAALSGEFFETVTHQCLECVDDESGDDCETCGNSGECTEKVMISWSSIKDIYSRAVELLAAPQPETLSPWLPANTVPISKPVLAKLYRNCRPSDVFTEIIIYPPDGLYGRTLVCWMGLPK